MIRFNYNDIMNIILILIINDEYLLKFEVLENNLLDSLFLWRNSLTLWGFLV